MAGKTEITFPLLKLGRLTLDPALRALPPGSAASGLVVTATVSVPDAPTERQYAWEVAWADAARQAGQLGADEDTARALAAGADKALAGDTRVVVAAHGEVLLARWLSGEAGGASVQVGPLPRLRAVATAAARRPACVVVLADRDGADILAYPGGDQPAQRFPVGQRPGEQPDPDPERPAGQLHGERHLTDREPESGGRANAEFLAGRVSQAAESVRAHIVLGSGDQHILDAVAAHLPQSLGGITTIAAGRQPDGTRDDHVDSVLGPAIGAALDQITADAISAVGDLLAERAGGPTPAAVRGIDAVAQQLAEQQVEVLLLAADIADAALPAVSYRIGSSPTEFLVGESDGTESGGTEVPLEDGLVWAALHQDAIIVSWPDRGGPLAGQPAAALLRRGAVP
jgi:hypothetical protein